MDIVRITTTFFSTNTYIICEGETAVVIDPGGDYHKISQKLKDLEVTCTTVLLTHGHFDHINAAAQLQQCGAKVYIHSLDEHMCLKDYLEVLGNRVKVIRFKPDGLLTGGDILQFGELTFKVIHTPGHTAGSVCYILDEMLFSGDTLFNGDIGRTDLPTGNKHDLQYSIKNKLFTLSSDYQIFPGHGDGTTLNRERIGNPYVER